jgi:Concanavalin A-like lectin/glucanases superfamily
VHAVTRAQGPDRRTFLRSAGLAGAGAVTLAGASVASASAGTAAPTGPATAAGRWQPDPDSPQFTLAVMPDTQFLYFYPSIAPDPQLASFQYILDGGNGGNGNIVFMAHLGDLTEDGLAAEFQHVGDVFGFLDAHGVGYSVLAGNHDVNSSTDDQRGPTPYLDTMGPQRIRNSPSFLAATADGYNTAHVFTAAGRQWLVLALDWRMSPGGFSWASQIIKDHPTLPVILTTHEIAGPTYSDAIYPYQYGDPENNAALSAYGQQVWDQLIKDNDQIFLTLNGHFWPPGRVTLPNTAGHDVHVHITNYQNRYYGGAAMIRLYHFDLARSCIDVETLAPWFLDQPAGQRNLLAAQEARLTTPADYFSVPIDFSQRFAGFAPVPPRPGRPARQLLVPGTLAYWRFDGGGATGAPVTSGQVIKDQSGHGNDLSVLVTVPGSASSALTWSGEYHPDQPGHASLYFDGGQNPLHGAYLTTADGAPLNTETFSSGYTFEAFLKIPTDWTPADNSWMALLSRWGESGQAGKSAGNTDPNEPIVTLSLSNGREPQWCVYPLNLDDESTNWGQGLPEDTWWHLAVVNDGDRTVMYVAGCEVVDNPPTRAVGLTQLGLPWVLGGYEYGGSINQIFHGWIGDVRIVNRALPVGQFMIAG